MSILDSIQVASGQSFQLISAVWQQGWFIFVPAVLLYMAYWYWLEYMAGEFIKSIKWVNISIDVPAENEESPKVMEEFFNAIHSVQTKPNFLDRFWKGKVQEWFSLEIVGIDGQVKFILRCPDYYKDLIEAHLYAQFPEVEVHQVEDYATAIPDKFKEAGYDLFGAEMVLTNKDFYPIRTYPFFEHQLTQRIIDPLSTLAEVMNKLKQGEQIWIQFTIRPVNIEVMLAWPKKATEFVQGLMGKETPTTNPAILEALGKAGDVASTVTGIGGEVAGAEESFPEAAFLMPPGQRKVVEAIERNVAKQAFEFKCRLVYVARKELFDKRRFNAAMGAFKQFNSYDMNGFKPYTATFTKVNYFFAKPRVFARQKKLLRGYKTRSWAVGTKPAILTSESLASLFHIPHMTVKAPSMTRTLAKKGSAPSNLPIAEYGLGQAPPGIS